MVLLGILAVWVVAWLLVDVNHPRHQQPQPMVTVGMKQEDWLKMCLAELEGRDDRGQGRRENQNPVNRH